MEAAAWLQPEHRLVNACVLHLQLCPHESEHFTEEARVADERKAIPGHQFQEAHKRLDAFSQDALRHCDNALSVLNKALLLEPDHGPPELVLSGLVVPSAILLAKERHRRLARPSQGRAEHCLELGAQAASRGPYLLQLAVAPAAERGVEARQAEIHKATRPPVAQLHPGDVALRLRMANEVNSLHSRRHSRAPSIRLIQGNIEVALPFAALAERGSGRPTVPGELRHQCRVGEKAAA
mmetsp:Transcript_59792/g.131270  ORF Transcript_59792/g.131270 Transcript_59792/m.131270 type:complete len:238 (+) Transcript_59792:149-862(+)